MASAPEAAGSGQDAVTVSRASSEDTQPSAGTGNGDGGATPTASRAGSTPRTDANCGTHGNGHATTDRDALTDAVEQPRGR